MSGSLVTVEGGGNCVSPLGGPPLGRRAVAVNFRKVVRHFSFAQSRPAAPTHDSDGGQPRRYRVSRVLCQWDLVAGTRLRVGFHARSLAVFGGGRDGTGFGFQQLALLVLVSAAT